MNSYSLMNKAWPCPNYYRCVSAKGGSSVIFQIKFYGQL